MAAFRSHLFALCLATAGAAYADPQQPSAAAFQTDTPDSFVTKQDAFDFVKREEMVPMREYC